MREEKENEKQRARERDEKNEREEKMQQIFSPCAHADELDAYAVSCTDPDINFTEECEHALVLRKRTDSRLMKFSPRILPLFSSPYR